MNRITFNWSKFPILAIIIIFVAVRAVGVVTRAEVTDTWGYVNALIGLLILLSLGLRWFVDDLSGFIQKADAND